MIDSCVHKGSYVHNYMPPTVVLLQKQHLTPPQKQHSQSTALVHCTCTSNSKGKENQWFSLQERCLAFPDSNVSHIPRFKCICTFPDSNVSQQNVQYHTLSACVGPQLCLHIPHSLYSVGRPLHDTIACTSTSSVQCRTYGNKPYAAPASIGDMAIAGKPGSLSEHPLRYDHSTCTMALHQINTC